MRGVNLCPASEAPWCSAMTPSIERKRVATTTYCTVAQQITLVEESTIKYGLKSETMI